MEQVILHRRNLHKIPELHKELPKTVAYIKSVLTPLGCTVIEPMKGAVCGYFDAGKEKTIAIRADIDALPIEERADTPYRSIHAGQMHACGHDGHTAMVLSLAAYAAEHIGSLTANLLVIFQPAEETTGGARELCETGILEQYHVSEIYGIHLWPGLEKGHLFTRKGAMMAKNSEVNLVIHGKSVHITRPDQGVDALLIGTKAIERIYACRDTELPAGEMRILGFGKMVSGTVRNAVSSETRLEGSLRVFSMDTFHFLTKRVREIAIDLEKEYGCTIEVSFSEGYPSVTNHEALVDYVMEKVPGLALLEKPDLTAEDFAFYQQRVPGVFFFLGTGDSPALHTASFDFDESILSKGVTLYKALLFNSHKTATENMEHFHE